MGVCKGCTTRAVGCHGKTADGAWRCGPWGEAQERKELMRAELEGFRDAEHFKGDGILARQRRRKSHHK